MADKFCLKMPDFHVTFRDLLHAVNLRHGTDGFTSPPKEGVLRIFFRSGLNPRNWIPKVSTLPLDHRSRLLLTSAGNEKTWRINVTKAVYKNTLINIEIFRHVKLSFAQFRLIILCKLPEQQDSQMRYAALTEACMKVKSFTTSETSVRLHGTTSQETVLSSIRVS